MPKRIADKALDVVLDGLLLLLLRRMIDGVEQLQQQQQQQRSRLADQQRDGDQERDGQGFVYVFRDKDSPEVIKVGSTASVDRRRGELERGSQCHLELILKLPTTHRLTTEHSVHGALRRATDILRRTDRREWYSAGASRQYQLIGLEAITAVVRRISHVVDCQERIFSLDKQDNPR